MLALDEIYMTGLTSGMPAPEEIQEKSEWLQRLACRNAGAGRDLGEDRQYGSGVRHAGVDEYVKECLPAWTQVVADSLGYSRVRLSPLRLYSFNILPLR